MAGPLDSFYLFVALRLWQYMGRHVANAEKLAQALQNHSAVKNIYYPALKTSQGYEIQRNRLKNGGAMISFELEEEYDIHKFLKV